VSSVYTSPPLVAEDTTRGRLVTEARRILLEKGYAELTLRAVAKAAGLSPGAPYRHFAHGYPELLATLALEGFEDLVAVLERRSVKDDPRTTIVNLALAYVRFGVERPDLYRAMFSARLAEPVELHEEMFQKGEISFSSRKVYANLARTKLEAFAQIVTPLKEAQQAGSLRRGDPEDFALAVAAMLHGLVGEFIDEGLGIRDSQEKPWSTARKEMSRMIIELLLQGLDKRQ
jgi:AcrR family transcriptional regulator